MELYISFYRAMCTEPLRNNLSISGNQVAGPPETPWPLRATSERAASCPHGPDCPRSAATIREVGQRGKGYVASIQRDFPERARCEEAALLRAFQRPRIYGTGGPAQPRGALGLGGR